MAQKAALDIAIESWKSKAISTKGRDDDIKSFTRKLSKSSKGGSSGSSSASMILAKRKKQLALAQLKTKQLLREQQLHHKMNEIHYERDLMEAKMEEEWAMESVNVYKELEDHFTDSQYKERLAELIPEEPLHPIEQQTREAAQTQLKQPHEQSVQHLEPLNPIEQQTREAAQSQLKKPHELSVQHMEPLHAIEQQTKEAAQSRLIQPHENSVQHLEPSHPTQHQTRAKTQPQLNPLEQPVLMSEPLDEVFKLRDNDRIRISGVKACETVSASVPNPVFSATGHTLYVDKPGACMHVCRPTVQFKEH